MRKMPASLEARYWGHVRTDRSRARRRENSLANPDGVTRPSPDRLAYAIAPSSRRSWRSPLVPTNTPAPGEARVSRAPATATAPWAARAPTTVPRGSDASSSASARNSSSSAGSASEAAIWGGRRSASKWLVGRAPAVRDHVPDVGRHGAARDRVHGDPLRPEFDGEIAAERLERSLRDADRRVAGDHALAPEARQRDDPPAGRHEPRRFLAQQEERARIGREDPVPLLRRQLEPLFEHARGGVADENVELPGNAAHLGDQALDLRGLLQVRLNEVSRAAAQLDVARRLLRRLTVDEEGHEDARAGLGETERDDAPDPPAAPRHQNFSPRRGSAQRVIPLAARSSGNGWSSRASALSRAALAARSVPGRASSSAYSSVPVATRRPSTSAVAASAQVSPDERSSARSLSWSPGRTKWRNETRASRVKRPILVQS